MIEMGQALQKRRQDMELSLSELVRLLGGTPGESYLSRVERGLVPLSPEGARKLARVLRVPEATLLNAAGHMTAEQVEIAVQAFSKLLASPADKSFVLPVLGITGEVLESRRRVMSADEDAFLIDLEGSTNEPYAGEALVLTARKPVDGIGVVAEVDGTLSAWTYRDQGGEKWIENGRRERRARGYKIRGIIARVATERSYL